VAVRRVEIVKMLDGEFHIKSITDYGQDGNVIVKSDFIYLVAIPLYICISVRRRLRV